MIEADIIELFNERAAIKEHCGRLEKMDAEKQAWYEIKKQFGLEKCPEQIVAVMKRTIAEWKEKNTAAQQDLF
jgi:hypothetical protein